MPDEPLDHDVVLADSRLVLRAFRLDDAQAILAAVSESYAELSRWLPWCHASYSLTDSLEFLSLRGVAFRREREYAFAVVERASGRLLGAAGINQVDLANRRANLGYWLRTSATGAGHATTATLLIARWAFSTLELERIEIVAALENLASQRVAQRAGAQREGVARRRFRIGDRQHDAVVFSLVPADLK